MFNYEEFVEYIKENIRKFLEPEFAELSVQIEDVRKNNGVKLKSLLISVPHKNVAPSIYLEDYYDDYTHGVSLDLILRQIGKVYKEGCTKADDVSVNIDKVLKDFDLVKSNIIVEIINTQQNLQLLQNVPYHIQNGTDLSLIYGVYVCGNDDYVGKILVTNELMQLWNVTVKDIHDSAIENTKRILPTQVIDMKEIVGKMFPPDFIEFVKEQTGELPPIPKELPMYIITNSKKFKGAGAAFIDEEVLFNLAKKVQDDLFILPSSVHECIAVPADERSVSELMEMVKEVNSTQVSTEDYLSDNVYFYEAQKRTLKMAHAQEFNQQLKHSR